MNLTLTFVTFLIASVSISASPVLMDENEDDMTLTKRVVGVTCTAKPGHGCIARREMKEDQFEEVGMVKRTRHKHHRHRHRHGHHHGRKPKGMGAMPPPMAMGGDASGAAGAGGMAAGMPDMAASAGGADMSAAQ